MSKLKWLLKPLSLLYGAGVNFRNFLYNNGHRKSVSFETNVFCVGNLSVGGTGKTPFIEYLIRRFSEKYKIAVLSRGYKRKSKGFILASENDTPISIGDEPFQIYDKFSSRVEVAVDGDRETAIPFILAERPETELILMDDGFQHRSVKPDFGVILTKFDHPFFKDYLLPFGRLRERRRESRRADAVVVTNCPEKLSFEEKQMYLKEIRKHTEASVFFGGVSYGECIKVFGDTELGKKVFLVTGIANSSALENYVKSHWDLVGQLKFQDHKHYSLQTLKYISEEHKKLPAGTTILTTEKDIVKWRNIKDLNPLKNLPVYYLPIEFKFLEDETRFENIFNSFIKKYQTSY